MCARYNPRGGTWVIPRSRSEARDVRQEARRSYDDDLRLVREALAGSLQARRRFCDRMRCVPKILAVKNARLGRPLSDEDVEDLAQEALVAIWRRLDSYQGLAALETWAYRFCHLVLSAHRRKLGRRRLSLPFVEADEAGVTHASTLEYEHVYRALEKVGPENAQVVRLRHFEHLSFEEIAVRLSNPTSTVKTHYYKTLARLREVLEPMRREAGL